MEEEQERGSVEELGKLRKVERGKKRDQWRRERMEEVATFTVH